MSGHLKTSQMVSQILSVTFFPSCAFVHYPHLRTFKILSFYTRMLFKILLLKKNFWKLQILQDVFQFRSPFSRSLWSAGFGGRLISYSHGVKTCWTHRRGLLNSNYLHGNHIAHRSLLVQLHVISVFSVLGNHNRSRK